MRTLHQQETHQLLEEVAHGDLAVPLLHFGAEVVIELFVDLIDVLDLVENGFDLLDGEHRLGGGGCCLQGFHGLGERRRKQSRDEGQINQNVSRPRAMISPSSCPSSPSTRPWRAGHLKCASGQVAAATGPNKSCAPARRGNLTARAWSGSPARPKVHISLTHSPEEPPACSLYYWAHF